MIITKLSVPLLRLAQRYDFGNQPEDHFKIGKTLKTKRSFSTFRILAGSAEGEEDETGVRNRWEKKSKSAIVGSFNLLMSTFNFRLRWRIDTWWKACAENHHSGWFLGVITNSFKYKESTVTTFTHVKEINFISSLFSLFFRERSHLFNFTNLQYSVGSINVYIVGKIPSNVLLHFCCFPIGLIYSNRY